MPLTNSLAELEPFDKHEQDYLDGRRADLPEDHLAEDIRQYRAINASNRGAAVDTPGPTTAEPATPEPTSDSPTLQEFMTEARKANPGVPRSKLAAYWNETYGHVDPQTMPTLEQFLPAAKEANPNAPDHALKKYWQENYGILGATEKAPPGSSLLRRAADVPIGLTKGVVDLPKIAVGLADIPTSGAASRGTAAVLDVLGEQADQLGLPAWARPSQWSTQLHDLYSPETRAAVAGSAEETRKSVEQAKAEGAGRLGEIAAGVTGTVKGIAKHPAAIVPLISENIAQMGVIAKGTAFLLKPLAASLNAEVVAGTKTAAEADALLGKAAVKYAAAGEGILSAGQVSSQISEQDPHADFIHRLAAVVAGTTTALITRGVAKIPGLGDIEASMAAKSLGRAGGFAGSLPERLAKGVLAEGILQELPQSAQEQLWQNLATGKPWQEGLGEQAVQGLVAGGVLGGAGAAYAGPSVVSRPLPAPPPEPNPQDSLAQTSEQVRTSSNLEAEDLARQEANAQRIPTEHIPAALGVTDPSVSLDDAITIAQELVERESPLVRTRPQAIETPILPGAEPTGPYVPTQPRQAWEAEGLEPQPQLIAPGSALTPRATPTPSPQEAIAQERARLLAMRSGTTAVPPLEERGTSGPEINPSDEIIPSAAEKAYPASERDRLKTQEELLFQSKPVEKRPSIAPTLLSGAEPTPEPTITPGTAFVPRGTPELTAKERLAQERARLLEMRANTSPQNLAITAAGTEAPPSVEDLHRLAKDKGLDIESSTFRDYTQRVTGKSHLDDLTPQERQALQKAMGETPTRVDEAAHQAAPSPQNALPEPTQPQKEAGNYQKGHVSIAGLDISIENPAGSTRSGTDATGKPWSITMQDHYGYIRGTKGKDKDHLDVFIKPGTPENYSGPVFVIDQMKPGTKAFDEHKIVMGATDSREARALYAQNYAKGWKGGGAISTFTMEQFKAWLKSDTTKPAVEYHAPQTPGATTPEAPTPQPATPQPVTVQLHLADLRHGGPGRLVNVNAQTVPSITQLQTVVHRSLKDDGTPTGDQYTVSEVTSGAAIASADTVEEAIAKAKKILAATPKELVDKKVADYKAKSDALRNKAPEPPKTTTEGGPATPDVKAKYGYNDLPEDVRNGIEEWGGEKSLNPKVAPLVYGLNQAGIKTTGSGDGYENTYVYVDLRDEPAATALPDGWILTQAAIPVMKQDLGLETMSKGHADQQAYLKKHKAPIPLRRLARVGGAVSAEEARAVVDALTAKTAHAGGPATPPVTKPNDDITRLGGPTAKTSADLIGKTVKPTAASGLSQKNAGKITHTITDSGGRIKIKVNGTGPHWYASDFERVPEKAAPAPTAEESAAEAKDKAEQQARIDASDALEKVPLSEEDKEEALRRAGTSMDKAEIRWEKRRLKGLTDQELTEALAYEFGIHGGNSGPGLRDITFKGGTSPVLEIEPRLPIGDIIKGKSLLALARKVFRVQQPGSKTPPKSAPTAQPQTETTQVGKDFVKGGRGAVLPDITTAPASDVISGPIRMMDESKEADLVKRLKDRLKGINANPMFDPRLMADAMQLGAIYLQKGANNFVAWSKQMVEILGKGIKPYLRPTWSALKAFPADQEIKPNVVNSLFAYGHKLWEKGTTEYEAFTAALKKPFGAMATPYADSVHAGIDAYVNAEEETEAPKTPKEKEANILTGSIELAKKVSEELSLAAVHGRELTREEFFRLADEAYDGTQGKGTYTPKDAFDALELGINLFLAQHKNTYDLDSHIAEADATIDRIRRRILSKIPSQQGLRTDEMNEYQQFSTPPDLAYAMNWVANVKADDVVLEPSAGVGGLAVFAKNTGATVIVNEKSERRFALLKELGFDQTLNENAEQLANIYEGPKPTVVIMNPPFSSTAGRIEGDRQSINVLRHLRQALELLPDGGRLVALIGDHNMGRDRTGSVHGATSLSQGVISGLAKLPATLKATIRLSGKGYAKYGTTYGNRILVYDKIPASDHPPVTGSFEDIKAALAVLQEVRNDRPARAESATTQSGSDNLAQPGERGARPEPPSDVSTPPVGPSGGRPDVATPGGSGGTLPTLPGTTGGVAGPRGGISLPHGRPETGPRGTTPPSGGPRGSRGTQGGGETTSGELPGGPDRGREPGAELPAHTNTGVTLEAPATDVAQGEISDSLYENYVPQKLRIEGAKPHPGKLVQSAALASTEPPDPTYTPNLPHELITNGALSLAQLEAIVYAGQSHTHMLPNGQRQGFFIGDGTGVGKGREISGIILDNMRQGRKKAIWVSEKENLVYSAIRDWTALGQNKDLFIEQDEVGSAKALPSKDGVLFTRYSMVASGSKVVGGQLVRKDVKGAKDGSKMASRLEQLIAWVGPDFDGVIAFDESHNMNNTDGEAGQRGQTDPSARAIAANELQRRLPKARIVYVSATGAKSVQTLLYTERLGLWGEGTPFPRKTEFLGKITAGGLGAMEMVTRDLKADGKYISRSLDYSTVTYEQLEHELDEKQTEIYNEMAKAWQIVLQNINAALESTGITGVDRNGAKRTMNGNAKGVIMGQFWQSQQRFFQQVLNSLAMPTTLKKMKQAIADGHAVVVQLVNTYEAGQKRELNRIKIEGADLESIDLTPRQELIEYLRKAFPVQQFEHYTDENGKLKSRPVTKANGDPVLNPEAVRRRDALIAKLGDTAFAVPDGPMDQIIRALGPENVAEVTGRKSRVIRGPDGDAEEQKRSRAIANMEVQQFKDDKRRALIFSDAGGTGESYDSDRTFKNQRRRYHFVTQPGWSAPKVIQGLGRTHRSNEANAPHVLLTMTNVKGHRRFISTVARGLDAIGALTQGQRKTGSSGLIDAKNNLENSYGVAAVASLFHDLVRGQVPSLPSNSDTLARMGLQDIVDSETGSVAEGKMPSVQKFLNRIMVLEIEEQNTIFDEFYKRLEAAVETAAANGTLDVGMETYRADGGIDVLDEQTARVDAQSGAKTVWTTLRAKHSVKFMPFEEARKGRFHKGILGFFRNQQSGKVWAAERSFQKTTEGGRIVNMVRLQGPVQGQIQNIEEYALPGYDKVSDEDAQTYWEKIIKNHPAYRTEDLNLISGALLKVWDRLPAIHNRIMRLQTTDGRRYLGRMILNADVNETKKNLGIGRSKIADSPETLIRKMVEEGARIQLANGWRIKGVTIGGEIRLELTGPELYSYRDQLQKAGVFWEIRNNATRYFIPNDEESAVKTLKALSNYHEVVQVDEKDGGLIVQEAVLPYGQGEKDTGQDELAARLDTSKKGKSQRATSLETMVDVGEKIGGARKDAWAGRGLSVKDLEGMSGGEESKFVTKHNVWKPDYADMVKNGTDPTVAATIKIFYDKLGTKPRQDTPEGRRNFVKIMTIIRTQLEGVKTEKDLKTLNESGWDSTNEMSYEARRAVIPQTARSWSWWIGGWSEHRRATRMVEQGWPNAEPWQRMYQVSEVLRPEGVDKYDAQRYANLVMSHPLWADRFPKTDLVPKTGAWLTNLFQERGVWRVVHNGSGAGQGYRPGKEMAEDLAKRLYDANQAEKPTGPTMPERPHLDKLIREGVPHRKGHVTAEDFREAFGFRGVEFGNWAASDERQKHIDQAYDALADLAEVLNLPPSAISLNGTLGLAFGARGGGAAAAHYEPSKLVINITKLRGPGSLAHEWGHALDHYFGEVDHPQAYTGAPHSITGWREKPRYSQDMTNLRPEMREAFKKILDAIYFRNRQKADTVRDVELNLEARQAELTKYKKSIADIYEEGGRRVEINRKYLEWANQHVERLADRIVPNLQQELATLREEPEKPGGYGRVESSYSKAADVLSGPTGDYWKRPTELFARSFESYIYDKLGRASQYLVHSVKDSQFAGSGYKADPYPAGVERKALNAAYDTLFETMLFEPTDKGMKVYEGLTESQALLNTIPQHDLRPHEDPDVNRAIAREALGDLDRAGTSVSALTGAVDTPVAGVHTVALGISAHLVHEGVVDLRGTSVTSAEDLAKVAQIYRDPRFETFRFIYTKGNQIVGHEGITSRLPAIVNLFPNRTEEDAFLKALPDRMAAMEADGYWLLHNHPSGRSNPSRPDRDLTEKFAAAVPGFQGHVIIDSNEYSLIEINEAGGSKLSTHPLDLGPDALLMPAIPHPLLGATISMDTDVLAIAKHLQRPDYVTVLYRSASGKTQAIQEMTKDFFNDIARSGPYLAEQGVAFGSQEIYAHQVENRLEDVNFEGIRKLVEDGILNDHVTEVRGDKVYGMRGNGIMPKRGMILGRRVQDTAQQVAEPRIIGDAGRDYTPAQRQAMQRTGSMITPKSLKETVRDLWKDAGKKMAQGLFDQFRPVRDLSMQAYTLLRLSKAATGAFEAFLNHGKLSLRDGAYDADTSGGVIKTVFVPLGRETTDFLRWVAGNRAERLTAEGKEHLFTADDIEAFKSLADGVADTDYTMPDGSITRDRTLIYRDSLKKFNAFNANILDMAEQSGLIDGDSRHLWEHEFYVPFYRMADDQDGGVRGMNIKTGVVRQEAFKQLKGGEQQLNDLLENTLMNWSHLIDASAKNRAAKATLDAAEQLGIAKPATYGAKHVVWYAGRVTRTIPKGTTYTEGGIQKVSDGTAKIQTHGKVEYTVSDPYLLDAINSLEYVGLTGPAMQAMSAMKHALTIGVTASPYFKVRNLIRDSLQSIATSEISYNPFANIAKGIKLTNRDSQAYVSALAGGGLIRFGTMLEGSEVKRTRQLIRQGVKETSILDSPQKMRAFYDRVIEPAIAAYNELGNRGEEINRMTLYDTLIKKGKSHAEASLLARDLLDFSMQGTWTAVRFLTQVVPFMNARLEGLYKLGRSAKEDKARFAIVLGATAVASLALLAAYQDDDDWKKREEWDRDNYWWFKIGGEAFRIPKPFEIGAIATLAERAAELLTDKEMTGTRFVERLLALTSNQLAMNPIPQAIKPIIDLYANQDSFTNRPIETMGMERLAPAERYRQSTSLVARGLSTAGNALTGDHFASPVQIDHVAQAYFGWLGAFVVGSADIMVRAVSNEPTRPALDYWKVATGGMVASTEGAHSRYVTQMYEQARELEQAHATWRHLLKEGKTVEAQDYRDSHRDELRRYQRVEHVKAMTTKQNERIRMIERSTRSPSEKRAQINAIRAQQETMARTLAPR